MKKYIDIFLKVIFSLILFFPILGMLGIFPPPTPDLYNTQQAFAFVEMLMAVQFINYIMVIVFVAAIVCLWTKRVALAALLVLPITVNIVGFHLFLDGGLFTPGAVLADVLLLLNAYFLWQNREAYRSLVMGDAKTK